MKETVHVALGSTGYDIDIGTGLCAEAGAAIRPLLARDRVFAVVDEKAAHKWLEPLRDSLNAEGVTLEIVSLPGGEAVKSWDILGGVCGRLLELGIQRTDPLIAFGGGAVGDLTGLAASLVHRGVPLIQMPTTLLSQVDSSVGGKTAINTPLGKNLVGTFYQPSLVLTDVDTLATLSARERAAGWAEIIKIAAIADMDLWNSLRACEHLGELRGAKLVPFIRDAVNAKARIVADDEREAGRRALLNFGHTFGHALETLARDKGDVLHGEAVAVGMMLAARLAALVGRVDAGFPAELADLLKRVGAPTSVRDLTMFEPSAEAMLALMAHDKKNTGDAITLILPCAAGRGEITRDIARDQLQARLRHLLKSG